MTLTWCADLGRADLRGADLRGADLRGACLRYANLSNADLRCADLTEADLKYADLTEADLKYADLTEADLTEAYGDNNIVITMQTPPYHTNLTKKFMQIGCRRYSYEEWWNFTDEEILNMDGKKALNFWRKYKEHLKLSYTLAFGEEKTPEE